MSRDFSGKHPPEIQVGNLLEKKEITVSDELGDY